MKPTRKVLRVSGSASTTRVDIDEDGYVHSVALDELNRQELISAAKAKFPAVAGNKWFRYGKPLLAAAIAAGVVPDDIDQVPALTGPATDKQRYLLRKLGAKYTADNPELTKEQASTEIDRLQAGREIIQPEVVVPNVTRPTDTIPEVQAVVAKFLGDPAPGAKAHEVIFKALDEPAPVDDAASQLASLVRQLAAGATQQVDEAQVHRIASSVAQEAVEAALSDLRPQVTEVHLSDREPVVLQGRQHAVFPKVLRYANRRHHVFLVGPAGTGKTTLAAQVAEALGLQFGAISLDPTLPPSRLFGYQDANGNYVSTLFRRCYEDGGVFLFDEIDNGHPGVLASINQALANGGCAFPDGYVKRHPDFICVAAGNTFGTGATRQYVGRNQLDAATLDRFWKVEVPIDEVLESHVVEGILGDEKGAAWLRTIRRYRANVERHNLLVIVSPRAAIEGAQALADGELESEVIADRIENGLSEDVLIKVRAR